MLNDMMKHGWNAVETRGFGWWSVIGADHRVMDNSNKRENTQPAEAGMGDTK